MLNLGPTPTPLHKYGEWPTCAVLRSSSIVESRGDGMNLETVVAYEYPWRRQPSAKVSPSDGFLLPARHSLGGLFAPGFSDSERSVLAIFIAGNLYEIRHCCSDDWQEPSRRGAYLYRSCRILPCFTINSSSPVGVDPTVPQVQP